MLISFSCLFAVVRTANTMLSKIGKSGHLCPVLNLGGKALSFSLLSMILGEGLQYMAFFMLRYIPSITSLLRVIFYHKHIEFCQIFFCIN